MEFTPMNFVENLKYMGLGMLAIIIVMGAIILVTMALNSIPDNNTYTDIRNAVNAAGNLYKGLIERLEGYNGDDRITRLPCSLIL